MRTLAWNVGRVGPVAVGLVALAACGGSTRDSVGDAGTTSDPRGNEVGGSGGLGGGSNDGGVGGGGTGGSGGAQVPPTDAPISVPGNYCQESGCVCPPEQEGQSSCRGCGQGVTCTNGRLQGFLDGICDARSVACGGDGYDAAVPPSVDQYCADEASWEVWVREWSTGGDPSTFCQAASRDVTRIEELPDCNGYDIVREFDLESTVLYYYDRQSHSLLGVRILGGTNTNCRAGFCPPIRETELQGCYDASAPITLCHQDNMGHLVPAYALPGDAATPVDAGPYDATSEVF